MRLLHTTKLVFQEFYEADLPKYAILSHRWVKPEDEWSYERFCAIESLRSVTEESVHNTPGLAKIFRFCNIAKVDGYEWCWVDTCCIDKRNSAELTEAINAMYSWYSNAGTCYAYLEDINGISGMATSSWFTRGWTLQELLAPPILHFFDRHWKRIGTRIDLKFQISHTTGIDEALLQHTNKLETYSIAQRMSWAASRQTSRIEDQAYCLLGLFGVNMPLLYGEGAKAFRRLQEAILENGGDNSLFAWRVGENTGETIVAQPSLLARSPSDFHGCGGVKKGFNTQRILFEVTNRGMMVLIHRSYDRKTLNSILGYAQQVAGRRKTDGILALTIPLGCYQLVHRPEHIPSNAKESLFLQVVEKDGRWHRMGVVQHYDTRSVVGYVGPHYLAYANDYIRLYVRHDWELMREQQDPVFDSQPSVRVQDLHFLHLRDAFDSNVDYEAQ